MGWQEDLARTNDPYLMTPSAVRKSAAASNRASLARRESGKDWKNKGGKDYDKRWDVRTRNEIEKRIREAGSDAGTMGKDLKDLAGRGIGNFIDKMPSLMTVKALTRHAEEVDEAERDYGKSLLQGGNPIALDQGSYADQFLEPLIKDKRAYNQAVRDDKVFWGDLERMSGDNYEASHPGYLALLNDPSRLDDMDPIRGLNYMRSITGDPTNMGFDEFEAWRQANPESSGLTATEIAQKLLPQYTQQANEMYGQGYIADKAREYADTPKPIGLYPGKYSDTAEEPIGLYPDKYRDTGIIPKIKPKPPFSQSELMDVTTTNLPGPEYGQELPAYSDAPTSILEDYEDTYTGFSNLGPGPLSGYTDRDLGDEELYNERLYKSLNQMNPLPVPLPPYLSENTDWWTPEPEAKGLIPRGLEELVEDQYGVDAPSTPRERKLPNTPPPGYEPPPPWYSRAYDNLSNFFTP